MKPNNSLRLTPFIVGFVLIGVLCAYFFTPIRTHATGLFGFILITVLLFGIAYYVNERVTERLGKNKRGNDVSFIRSSSKKRVETLEQDVDNLSEIVRDLAHLVDKQQKNADYSLLPQDFTFYLRPASHLTGKEIYFYEALTETHVRREMTDEMRISLLFEKSNNALKRLLQKNSTLKIMINIPFMLIENGMIERLLRKNDHCLDYIFNIEGVFGASFSPALALQMKTLSKLGIEFCLTEPAPLLKMARLKTMQELNEHNITYLRASYNTIENDGTQKADFDQLKSYNITCIIDDLDDTVNAETLENLGITLGQGPKIGIARPVKADFLTPLSVTLREDYRKSA
jgi:hypothetical protein